MEFWKRFVKGMVYDTSFYCKNCGVQKIMHVMKGTTKEEFVISKLCPNCLTSSLVPA